MVHFRRARSGASRSSFSNIRGRARDVRFVHMDSVRILRPTIAGGRPIFDGVTIPRSLGTEFRNGHHFFAIHAMCAGHSMFRASSCCSSTSSMKCIWPARRKITICFVAVVLSNSSYMPERGIGQLKVSFAWRIPGCGCECPPGATATIARTRGSVSGVASAVQPPKLCPTIRERSTAALRLRGGDQRCARRREAFARVERHADDEERGHSHDRGAALLGHEPPEGSGLLLRRHGRRTDQRRPPHSPHRLELFGRRLRNVRVVNPSRGTPRVRGGSPAAR